MTDLTKTTTIPFLTFTFQFKLDKKGNVIDGEYGEAAALGLASEFHDFRSKNLNYPLQRVLALRMFLKAQSEGIGKIKLETLTLKTNFRSQKKLVAWVNECFAEIFPPADDPILGAVKYTEAQAAQSEEDFSGVVAHPVAEPKSGEEADLIAQLIREIRQQHSTASIAVLVRARAHLKNIVLLRIK